jgi:alpha-D-xyloside xylohydrolase
MPYIWSLAVQATRTGAPLLRAMVLELPEDPAAPLLDQQYLLGPSLLVAPVFSESGDVTYYLPPGTWTDLLTGERREGGCYVHERSTTFLRIPLWVRPATLLLTSSDVDRPDHDATQALRLEPFELAEGARVSAEVFSPDAERQLCFEAQHVGQQLRLRIVSGRAPAGARYTLVLPGGREIPWKTPDQELVVSLA